MDQQGSSNIQNPLSWDQAMHSTTICMAHRVYDVRKKRKRKRKNKKKEAIFYKEQLVYGREVASAWPRQSLYCSTVSSLGTTLEARFRTLGNLSTQIRPTRIPHVDET